ncbi:MAG: hypothetical protein DRO12_00340 [Thermoprotei archaeon]|nr:MAG: hypothetical protein DRO12_00340 [Thermoprotei archaeon]
MKLYKQFGELAKAYGFEVKKMSEGTACEIFMVKKDDRVFVVAAYIGSYKGFYTKIVLLEHVPVSYWSCENLMYVPHGLYAFADDEKELVEKTLTKINKMINYARGSSLEA